MPKRIFKNGFLMTSGVLNDAKLKTSILLEKLLEFCEKVNTLHYDR